MKHIKCPHCGSKEVDILYKLIKIVEPVNYELFDRVATEQKRVVSLLCQCGKCNKKFKIDYENERFITFDKPPVVDQKYDIKLHCIYDSNLNSGYRIISLDYNDIERYLLYIKDEYMPVLLSEERVSELLNNIDEGKRLVHNIKAKRRRRD